MQKTFIPIQAYPALRVDKASAVSWLLAVVSPYSACWISAQAATIELRTIRPNENRAEAVTLPPNQSTSPYAVTIMVRFLKIVYTGTDRNCRALVLV